MTAVAFRAGWRCRSSGRGRFAAVSLLLVVGAEARGVAGEVPAIPGQDSPAPAASTAFDTDILRQRGLDPQIADYFRETPRFRPGRGTVDAYLNDIRRGRINARFSEQGELCFDKPFLDAVGLVLPGADFILPGGAAGEPCYDYARAFPGTTVVLRPGQEEVRLLAPTTALRLARTDYSGYSRGGTALLYNYDLMGMRNESQGFSSSNFMFLNSEAGLNSGDWILRSRSYAQRQGQTGFRNRHLYAYGQRTWPGMGATLQGGQINIANSLLTGAPLTGLQLFPDTALSRQDRNIVMVEGIAQSQARVEVRQAGALIYSTVVPPGPFVLTDLPLLNHSSDLNVSVIEADGAPRHFVVPAASINAGSLDQRPGYAFALGRSRSLDGDDAREPWVGSVSGSRALGRQTNLGLAALLAPGYRAGSWGMDTRLGQRNSLKLQQRLSQATQGGGRRGTQIEVSGIVGSLGENLNLSFSSAYQTIGYRALEDFTQRIDGSQVAARYRRQHSLSLGWLERSLGGFTLGYSQASLQNGERSRRLNLSWGKSFAFASVSLSAERDLGHRRRDGYGYGETEGSASAYYLSVSIPLGKRSVRSYARKANGYTRFGASYNEQRSEALNYSLSAERDTRERNNTVSAQVAAIPKYAQLNLGFSDTANEVRSYYAGASGGLVAHADGVTLSPYAVQDTFGIVSAAGMPGVKVATPQGSVWTDPWGRAVVSQLSAYSSSRVEVDTRTLPRNIDINNGFRLVDAGRGSVNWIDFDLTQVRRLLLNAHDSDGKALPAGAYVLDGQQQYVGTVLEQGLVFLGDGLEKEALTVALPDGQQCVLRYELPDETDPDKLFERADALCVLQ